ncbi:4'-phosphopantetheinyl transferase superfamily protein [uncultured Cohaesibacter sp.]|uniref:4'-phosphopantetheinyl transferase family protein n=1 Tax=uncultured Cohaesibacter sp. TaxID=1002546 RepID=UPI0029C7AEB7|nr:4'-phosphopantetheinyl transferase superfamily protein [uncultured Cohaesibacter sp.]
MNNNLSVTVLGSSPADTDQLEALLPLLSDEERSRQSTMRLASDRWNFALAHCLLRKELSRWHPSIAPQSWIFERTKTGKPVISAHQQTGIGPLDINITHTDGLVACAITNCGQVGIDAERWSRDIAIDRLARDVLTHRERTLIAKLPKDRQKAAFISHWTLKEASLKATGIGLNVELPSLDCHFANSEQPFSGVANIKGLPLPGETSGTDRENTGGQIMHLELFERADHALALAHLGQQAPVSPSLSECRLSDLLAH